MENIIWGLKKEVLLSHNTWQIQLSVVLLYYYSTPPLKFSYLCVGLWFLSVNSLGVVSRKDLIGGFCVIQLISFAELPWLANAARLPHELLLQTAQEL